MHPLTFYVRNLMLNNFYLNHFSESSSHFLMHYNISKMAIFPTPSSTPAGDRRMCLPTFLYEI